MGFCTEGEWEEFLRTVPEFEKMLVRSGIKLIKYWLSITADSTGGKRAVYRQL
jgi:polyphosphate kinase 2 (PPK2 family)